MRFLSRSLLVSLCFFVATTLLSGQKTAVESGSGDAQAARRIDGERPDSALPRDIRFSGVLSDEAGAPRSGTVTVTFALYKDATGAAALWTETQTISLQEGGRYAVLVGNSGRGGLPRDMFTTGEARWLGVRVAEEGAAEQPRVQLVSVPYALASADAQSLGGRPATDFQLTRAAATASGQAAGVDVSGAINSSANTVNRIAKFTALDTIGDSAITESGGLVGIGNTNPQYELDVVGAAVIGLATERFAFRSGSMSFNRNVNTGAIFDGTRHAYQMQHTGSATGANDNLAFQVYNPAGAAVSTDALTISGQGNVGIATTTPILPLDVRGAAVIGLGPERFSFRGSSMAFNRNATNGAIFNPNRHAYQFEQTGSLTAASDNLSIQVYAPGGANLTANALSITGTGSVGVGTATPGTALDVIGTIRSNTGGIFTGNNSTQVVIATQNAAGVAEPSVGVPPPAGIRGDASSTTGVTAGVLGVTSAVTGRGVLGLSLASSGFNAGVFGQSASSEDGTGVWGESRSPAGESQGVFGRAYSTTGTGVLGEAISDSGDAVGVAGISRASGGTGVLGQVTALNGENYGISGRVIGSTNTASTAGMFINNGSGSLLVGRNTTAGGAQNVFRIDTTGKGFFNGGTQTSGADFAESVAVKLEKSEYQPGDLIAIDTTGTRRFAKSASAYSTLVAGIYSTKPGVLATPHTMDDPRIMQKEIPLAVVGIVPCKVTSENGAIKAGDLLVSSSREGYAMKGTDRKRMNGAVVGKALQDMNGATGVIEVLVSLQ